MGNCLRSEKSSSMVWAGDDWGSLEGSKTKTKTHHNTMHFGVDDHDSSTPERLRLLHEITPSSSSSNIDSNCREVKIKITKKELDRLLGTASGGSMQGLSVEQFLSQLLSNGGDRDLRRHHSFGVMEHQRSWMPGLQSIPEVN